MDKKEMTSRTAHVEWAKKRALEYVEVGDLAQAMTSLQSDLLKNPATADHMGLEMMMPLYLAGHINTAGAMRNFIEGFN